MAITGGASDDEKGSEASIKTFETADSVRSLRESIISLYDRTPYDRNTWSTSQESFLTAQETQNNHTVVSELVEDYLSGLPIPSDDMKYVHEDSMDNPTVVSKASEYSLPGHALVHLGIRPFYTTATKLLSSIARNHSICSQLRYDIFE
jgi:hypothetical protein